MDRDEVNYPPDEQRRAMREVVLAHLARHPAEFTATTLVARIRDDIGDEFTERELRLELSRMLGGPVVMRPNRTLARR